MAKMTGFEAAWKRFKADNAMSFVSYSLGNTAPDTYLENRLHRAFSNGWRAGARECGEVVAGHCPGEE